MHRLPHTPDGRRTDLSRPSLKGAYHQLCINCHRGWDSAWQKMSDCYSCHPKISADISKDKKTLTELAEKRHPTPKTPKLFLLKSAYDEAPIVTFYHNRHIVQFGLNCVDCHRGNVCTDCHKSPQKQRTVVLNHENCMPCHKNALDENCNKCHGNEKKPPFDHAKTGWRLKPFHKSLPCKSCHQDQTEFQPLKTDCNYCHKTDWKVGSFNHKITGIQLDENHREIDCEICHLSRNFRKKPQCAECHDDKTFPRDIPGKKIKR
ncbi:MAG: hypothetical protein GXO77_03855 [Calditrichaeota bacterium]|nr:hypothetical protein [Calditrichota bacterium]